jgi:hypothetical protein
MAPEPLGKKSAEQAGKKREDKEPKTLASSLSLLLLEKRKVLFPGSSIR